MTKPRETDFLRAKDSTLLSDNWGRLTRYDFSLKRSDGAWQDQRREVYDRGHGAVCLLHNPAQDTFLLTRQFRLPVHLSEEQSYLIEAPAGLLEGADPATRMRAELEEETGYQVSKLMHLYDAYTSPGSVTERLSFFKGTYGDADKVSAGGGHADEGEDIEVMHVPFAQALEMISDGRIRDAKTIMLIQHYALERLKNGD